VQSFHSGNHKHGGGRINAAANILLNKLSLYVPPPPP